MPQLAAFPSWMFIVLFFVFVGPMMRMMFGGSRYGMYEGRKRIQRRMKERLKEEESEEIGRLDAAIQERDVVIEDLQRRLTEMESRLDFTERLLADRHTPADLSAK